MTTSQTTTYEVRHGTDDGVIFSVIKAQEIKWDIDTGMVFFGTKNEARLIVPINRLIYIRSQENSRWS